jgi:hypothetical protein
MDAQRVSGYAKDTDEEMIPNEPTLSRLENRLVVSDLYSTSKHMAGYKYCTSLCSCVGSRPKRSQMIHLPCISTYM